MADSKSSNPRVLHFTPIDNDTDPLHLIWAIQGIARTLDQADITSARGAEADRISKLTTAAAILSDQLCRMAQWPETKPRRIPRPARTLEVVRA